MIRVLVADNNVELCQTLEEFLNAQSDMEVVALAYDGEEALCKIKETTPDVVILDITMPHLDGMAVLERLSSLGVSKSPKVIVLTALGREDIIQRFTDLGAHYFIVKPFDLDVLAERIRQFSGPGTVSVVKEAKESYKASSSLADEAGVTQLLHEMGVPPHFKGYNYLRDAVLMVLREDSLLGGSLTKRLYPRLADKYGSTPGGVEAAIRNAVISAWESGNRDFLERLTGRGGNRKGKFPTNSMMIAKLADHIRLGKRVG